VTPSGYVAGGRRLARVGAVAGAEAAKTAAMGAANLTRSERRRQAARESREADFVERIVIMLGSMRGVAVKFGQMLSLADGGLIPAAYREHFQERLAALQDGVPPVPWDTMRGHIEKQLGGALGSRFNDFDERPVAAASIGQVYRARLRNGREVAVKIQYPGIEEAVRSDMQLIALVLRVIHQVYPGVDVRATLTELQRRIGEELDYDREAKNTRAMARAYRDHPFIHTPGVVSRIGTRRLIVTDWIEGAPLLSARDAPDARRGRIAETLFRFYAGGAYDTRIYSLDPHPGNALLLGDGRVAFIDFGSVERVSRADVALSRAVMRALVKQDPEELALAIRARGIVSHDPIPTDALYATFSRVLGWYAIDQTLHVTPAVADEMLSGSVDIHSSAAAVLRRHEIPPELAVIARADVALAASLGQLRPTINLHRIAREWICGSEPVTELGRHHAEWRAARTTNPPVGTRSR